MKKGCVFDIREFTVHDGPGTRVTVFMKGCPLRCRWCHNPEGLSFDIQKNMRTGQTVGKIYSSHELVEKISAFKPFFTASGGGVTFSGGEATAQEEFIYECCKKLSGIHKCLDTSGFCKPDSFEKLLSEFDLIYYDIKIADSKKHEEYTGQSNETILENLNILCKQKKIYNIRIPLIPNITDTEENLSGIEKLILNLNFPPKSIDLLPYNNLAAGKYEQYGMEYQLSTWFTKNNKKIIKAFESRMRNEGFNVNLY